MALKLGARKELALTYKDENGDVFPVVVEVRRPSSKEWIEYTRDILRLNSEFPLPAEDVEKKERDAIVGRRNLEMGLMFQKHGAKVVTKIIDGVEVEEGEDTNPVTLFIDECPQMIQVVGLEVFGNRGGIEADLGKSDERPEPSSPETTATSSEPSAEN
jgi:hypothetical protein